MSNRHHVSAETLGIAYRHCINNRREVEQSGQCGCFCCKKAFAAAEVVEWIDDGETAVCPKCGEHSVLPDKFVERAADQDFLRQMRRQYFGAGNA